jgi:hypothetical protein
MTDLAPPPESPVSVHHDEARHLLAVGGGLRGALDILMAQFNVLQARAQVLLTVSTLALTITGFSGPRVAQSGDFPRLALAGGLVLVLASMLLILGGSLRIRWVTQFRAPPGGGDDALVAQVVCHRDRKTRLFFLELCLLLAGLALYVSALVAYFLFGKI